jgi:hypothetical protein
MKARLFGLLAMMTLFGCGGGGQSISSGDSTSLAESAKPQDQAAASLRAPVVENVSSSGLWLKTTSLVAVSGVNLPVSIKMSLGGTDCITQSAPAPSESGFVAVCLPSGIAGLQPVVISSTGQKPLVDSTWEMRVQAAIDTTCVPPLIFLAGRCQSVISSSVSDLFQWRETHVENFGWSRTGQILNGAYDLSQLIRPGSYSHTLRYELQKGYRLIDLSFEIEVAQSGANPELQVGFMNDEAQLGGPSFGLASFVAGLKTIYKECCGTTLSVDRWVVSFTASGPSCRRNDVVTHCGLDPSSIAAHLDESYQYFAIVQRDPRAIRSFRVLDKNVAIVDVDFSTTGLNIIAEPYSRITTAGELTFSGVYGDRPLDWSCTRDNKTGVIYELKMPTGYRARALTYTHFTSTFERQNVDAQGIASFPSQAELDAPSNALTFINRLNSTKLCGRSDWRLPTLAEATFFPDNYWGDPRLPTAAATFFPDIELESEYNGPALLYGFKGYSFWLIEPFKFGQTFGMYALFIGTRERSVRFAVEQRRNSAGFVRGVSGP